MQMGRNKGCIARILALTIFFLNKTSCSSPYRSLKFVFFLALLFNDHSSKHFFLGGSFVLCFFDIPPAAISFSVSAFR